MQQTVMVFDDSSARDTALTGVVAEGMFSYLKSDDTLYQYNGTAWEVAGSPEWLTNYPTNTPELAAESSGQVLMTTGGTATPVWQPMPTVNYIINGAFDIWQRGTSFSNYAPGSYTADRWVEGFRPANPTTYSITRQSLSLAELNLAGFGDLQYYARCTITTAGSSNYHRPFTQRIEDVRTLAGQTFTVSFWAKADSARTLTVSWQQLFGSGGSPATGGTGSSFSLTSSWQRFSYTTATSSISGKTIGAGSYLELLFQLNLADGAVLDITGVQLEAGSIATPFKRHAPSLALENEACKWYFERQTIPDFNWLAVGQATSATAVNSVFNFVQKRAAPSITTTGNYLVQNATGTRLSGTSISFSNIRVTQSRFIIGCGGGLVAGDATIIQGGSTPLIIDINSEL
jgi:hypothetical protein